MKTVDKAMSLLDQFSMENTEIGLNEMSRLAGTDKAATRRLLVALGKHGFIEQLPDTRKYRLGHGFLRLARLREATVPISKAARDVAEWLIGQVNETVHVSIPGDTGMITIAHQLPRRGHVINIVPSQLLYYHATASGLAFLAFASDDTARRILSLKRDKIASATMTSKSDLKMRVQTFRAQGYSQTHNSFEDDVASIAMPFFQDGVDPAGSIAMALPGHDMTDARRDELLPVLREAVARLELALTGF